MPSRRHVLLFCVWGVGGLPSPIETPSSNGSLLGHHERWATTKFVQRVCIASIVPTATCLVHSSACWNETLKRYFTFYVTLKDVTEDVGQKVRPLASSCNLFLRFYLCLLLLATSRSRRYRLLACRLPSFQTTVDFATSGERMLAPSLLHTCAARSQRR